MDGSLPVAVPDFEPTTAKVLDVPGSGRAFLPAPPGTPVTANPPLGDYLLDPVARTIRRTQFGAVPDGEEVRFSYVPPSITTTSVPYVRTVDSSARPLAPKVLYVVPTFRWSRGSNPSTMRGGGVRVYLERPWGSSGDGEQLGVVLWKGPGRGGETDPLDPLDRYVTMWGRDPLTLSKA